MHYHEEETVGDEYEENENTLELSERKNPISLLFSSIMRAAIIFIRKLTLIILKIFIQRYMMWCITSNLSLRLTSKI